MKTRPIRLTALSAFLLVVALGFPAQIMVLYGHGPDEMVAIAAKLSPLNWAALALSLLSAWLLLRASSLLVVTLPILGALVVYNNWFVSSAGGEYSPWVTALASVLFLAGLVGAWDRESLNLLFQPRRRWWMTPRRSRTAIPIRVRVFGEPGKGLWRKGRAGGGEFYGKTFDISESGVFIPLEETQPTARAKAAARDAASVLKASELGIGSQCFVSIAIKELTYIQVRAEVVRTSAARGIYPAGIGLRFLGLSREDRRRISEALAGPVLAVQSSPSAS
jgi:hypothetical protein